MSQISRIANLHAGAGLPNRLLGCHSLASLAGVEQRKRPQHTPDAPYWVAPYTRARRGRRRHRAQDDRSLARSSRSVSASAPAGIAQPVPLILAAAQPGLIHDQRTWHSTAATPVAPTFMLDIHAERSHELRQNAAAQAVR